jgi:hypothetical protein
MERSGNKRTKGKPEGRKDDTDMPVKIQRGTLRLIKLAATHRDMRKSDYIKWLVETAAPRYESIGRLYASVRPSSGSDTPPGPPSAIRTPQRAALGPMEALHGRFRDREPTEAP